MMSTLARSLALALSGLLVVGCASARVPRPPPSYATVQEQERPHGALATARHDLAAAPARVWSDTKAVFSDGVNLVALLGASAYAFAQERGWEDSEATFFKNHTIYSGAMQDVLGALGNGLTLYAGTLTWYFLAQDDEDPTSYRNSKTVLSALTVTSLTTLLLKGAIGDGRPNGGSHDFPSGHASASMSVAASLDELYGHGVGIPAMLLSGAIGLQRLDIEKHDSGAVVFGWVLGYVVGHTVAARSTPKVLGLEVGLYQDPDSGSLGLSLSGGL